ncbi:MAG: phosphoribosyltransferase family protein [Candidatus Acidiferrales bacterium]
MPALPRELLRLRQGAELRSLRRHPLRGHSRGVTIKPKLIARPLAKRLNLRLDPHLLVRTRPRPPQLVLSRSEHWKSVRGAYATREDPQVDNLRILLVDDVLTTGATLDACARALKSGGAAVVVGLTAGRVRSWSVAPGPGVKAFGAGSKPGGPDEHP